MGPRYSARDDGHEHPCRRRMRRPPDALPNVHLTTRRVARSFEKLFTAMDKTAAQHPSSAAGRCRPRGISRHQFASLAAVSSRQGSCRPQITGLHQLFIFGRRNRKVFRSAQVWRFQKAVPRASRVAPPVVFQHDVKRLEAEGLKHPGCRGADDPLAMAAMTLSTSCLCYGPWSWEGRAKKQMRRSSSARGPKKQLRQSRVSEHTLAHIGSP